MITNRFFIIFTSVLLFSACSSYKIERGISDSSIDALYRWEVRLPNNYKKKIITAGEGGTETHLFIYPDSSMFYVSEKEGLHPNYDNIMATASPRDIKRRMYGYYKFFLANCDTIVLEGIDGNNCHWKEISYRIYDTVYSFGYKNVSEQSLPVFTSIMDSYCDKWAVNPEFYFQDVQYANDSLYQIYINSEDSTIGKISEK
ncbi:MAG: hypothetical protein IJ557_08655 [Bacteroidaceae bacterium]|nr:hypothetical protein [Bacteroidaceae bacterium]